jgi:hypothetical protein
MCGQEQYDEWSADSSEEATAVRGYVKGGAAVSYIYMCIRMCVCVCVFVCVCVRVYVCDCIAGVLICIYM